MGLMDLLHMSTVLHTVPNHVHIVEQPLKYIMQRLKNTTNSEVHNRKRRERISTCPTTTVLLDHTWVPTLIGHNIK